MLDCAHMVTHRGSCHCERVRIEVDAPADLEVTECNCSICARTAYQHLIVPQGRFRLISGSDALVSYRFHTRTADHLFCGTCGIKVFYRPRSHPEGWSVNARCLDPATVSSLRVARQFDGARWDEHAAELPPLYA